MLREVPGYSIRDPIRMASPNNTPDNDNDDDNNNNRFEPTNNNTLDDIFGSAPNSPLQPARHHHENNDDDDDDDDIGVLDPSSVAAPSHAARRQPAAAQLNSGERSDIPRLRSTHVTAGYRDGIAESKARYVQEGFDEGYSLGAVLGLRAGWLVGVFEGVVRAVVVSGGVSSSSSAAAAAAADDHDKEAVGEELRREFLRCREELGIRKLFGPSWFGEDGIWKFEVEAENDRDEVTFREVADAHPALRKWKGKIDEIAKRFDLDLSPKLGSSEQVRGEQAGGEQMGGEQVA